MEVELQAQAIAKEAGGEVLRFRIEGDQLVVLLVDGRKIRQILAKEADAPAEAPPKKEKKK